MFISVSLSVTCEEEVQVPPVMEALGRVAAGIALEGRSVHITIVTVDEETD